MIDDEFTLDGKSHFVPLVSPVCSVCQHIFAELDPPDGVDTWHCKAFPHGIPMDIWLGDDPHTKSRNGELTFKRIIENPQK